MLNEELIKNWLYKTDKALKAVKDNLDSDNIEAAQNRLYYAMFYIVSALGQSKGFITSKHGQLIGWFNREYIKTGILPKKYGELYRNTFKYRQETDYGFNFTPDKKILETMFEEAKIFIEEIKKLI